MAEKTYNTGRVVGWSTYEEFLKETGADPNVITSYMYNTLVTYGVTRVVELSSREDAWKPSKGGQFYTQTVRVQGASWGAVPIVGIDYESYLDVFTDPHKSSQDVESVDVVEKSALEEAIGNIFAVYVSDAEGKKMQSSVSDHGYLTFAAYPDILKFNTDISGFPGGMMRLIVRGLSMEDLDVNTLYFGPQGFVFAGNGLVEDCYHETRDINNLSLNSAGYLWLSMGGNPTPADYRGLVNHPEGQILISTFGYLDSDFLNGTGDFRNAGRYALTYKECKAALNGLNVITTQVNAIPEKDRDQYVYLVAGSSRYEGHPPAGFPFFIIPVRKSDGKVNIGSYDTFTSPKFKKIMDFTRLYAVNSDQKLVMFLYDKQLPEYLGNWWGGSTPASHGLVWTGNNTFKYTWETTDMAETENANYSRSGRHASYKLPGVTLSKGNMYILSNQSDKERNGVYQCTNDVKHTYNSYASFNLLNRRGGYIAYDIPEWWFKNSRMVIEVSLSGYSTTITANVLYVDGCPIYPGELLMLGRNPDDFELVYVVNTIENGSCKLIVTNINVPSITISESDSNDISDESDAYSRLFTIPRSAWNLSVKSKSYTVYTSETSSYSFTQSNTDVSVGMLFNITHHKDNMWGEGKNYTYIVLDIDSNVVKVASAMVWVDNPTLSATVGYPGNYDAIVPRYHQNIPDGDSYYYNMKSVLARTKASKLFSDFGWKIADYVHEDYQNLSLGEFLRQCVLRSDMSVAMSPSTNRGYGIKSTFYLYSKSDLNYTSGVIPNASIQSSITIEARTTAQSFFDTAYYTATKANGDVVNINNSDYPIWVTVAKSRSGNQTMSVSVIDDNGGQLDFTGNEGSIEVDKITWLDLLTGLGSGQSVDLLHGMVVRKDANDCNYLITADGTRLYISTEEPKGDDILDGSIGIGW